MQRAAFRPSEDYWLEPIMINQGIICMAVPADKLQQWHAEIAALPPRKRGAWKLLTRSSNGALHRIRYAGPEIGFQLKCHQTFGEKEAKNQMVYPASGWAPMYSEDSFPTEVQIRASYGNKFCDETVVITSDPIRTQTDSEREQILEASGLEGEERELLKQLLLKAAIERNHTGLHHRNHRTTVPTPAGQPMRG